MSLAIGNFIGIAGGGSASLNPFAKAYINKILLTRSLTNAQKKAINDYVVTLLAYNTTNANFFRPDDISNSVIRGIWLLWWGSYDAVKWNLVEPVDNLTGGKLTELTTVTYNAAGAKSSVSVGLDTNIYANSFPLYSMTLGTFPYENNLTAGNDIGATETSSSMARMRIPSTANNLLSSIYGTDGVVITPITDTLGFFITTRTSRTSHKVFKNGAQIGATNTTSIVNITPPTTKITLLGASGAYGGATTRGQSMAMIGKGMTDAEILYFNNASQKLKLDLGLLNYFFLEDESYLYSNSYLS